MPEPEPEPEPEPDRLTATVRRGWQRQGRPVDIELVAVHEAAAAPARKDAAPVSDANSAPALGGTPFRVAPRSASIEATDIEPAAERPPEAADMDVDLGDPEPDRPASPAIPATSMAVPASPRSVPVAGNELQLVRSTDTPMVARDPTSLGPSLPRRAGSLVRRWITRVVSFVRRLPGKLGFGSSTDPEPD